MQPIKIGQWLEATDDAPSLTELWRLLVNKELEGHWQLLRGGQVRFKRGTDEQERLLARVQLLMAPDKPSYRWTNTMHANWVGVGSQTRLRLLLDETYLLDGPMHGKDDGPITLTYLNPVPVVF